MNHEVCSVQLKQASGMKCIRLESPRAAFGEKFSGEMNVNSRICNLNYILASLGIAT